MLIDDYTKEYFETFAKGSNWEAYEKCYPALLGYYKEHYGRTEEARPPSINTVSKNSKIVRDAIEVVFDRFTHHGFDISKQRFVLFVGENTSNGHAFKDGDELIVWLPVETYTSKMLAEVFIAHELAHALHYRMSPEFYTTDKNEMWKGFRQLVTEGLATYVSREVMGADDGTALWADFLNSEQLSNWMKRCREKLEALCSHFIDVIQKDEKERMLFLASDPDDVLKFRAGYFVGLKVVEEIVAASDLSIQALLTMSESDFKAQTLRTLKRLS
jgi:uncharacterized protein YjaZ